MSKHRKGKSTRKNKNHNKNNNDNSVSNEIGNHNANNNDTSESSESKENERQNFVLAKGEQLKENAVMEPSNFYRHITKRFENDDMLNLNFEPGSQFMLKPFELPQKYLYKSPKKAPKSNAFATYH